MYYALTIKKTRGDPIRSDYEGYLATMYQKNPGLQDCGTYYETERGLHLHALLFKRGNTLGYSDVLLAENQRGWSIRLKLVYNLAGWKRYITKHQTPKRTDSSEAKRDVCEDTRQDESVSTESIEEPKMFAMEEEDDPKEIYKAYGRIV